MRNRFESGFLILMVAVPFLWAAPLGGADLCQVEGITVAQKGDVSEVVISASAPLSYRDFALSNPPRIVVDCFDALYASSSPVEVPSGLGISEIRASQWPGEPGRNITRVVVELGSERSYSLSTTEKGLIIVIGKKTAEPKSVKSSNHNSDPPTSRNGLVSLDVQGADINTVMRSLAEFGGKNIVCNKAVKGVVSVRLKAMPWRDALDIILRTQGLSYVEEQGVLRVATAEELRNEEIDKQTAERKKEELLPLIMERVEVKFANAAELKVSLEKMLTRRGYIEVDQRTNSLIITDIADRVASAESMARELDSMTPQVEITAKLVDVDVSVARNLGVVWSAEDMDIGKQNVSEDISVDADIENPAGTLRIGAIRDYVTLDATLHALETQNKADIISNPRITTVNNREASILVGKEIPLIVQDNAGNPITQLKKIGITLRVTPHINSEKDITLDIHPEVSDLSSASTVQGGVIINTTEADTRVIVQDGETAVIGGLIRENTTKDKSGVPILQHIPLLGFLFRSSNDVKSKRELLIFITPRIVPVSSHSSPQ
ncbi:MAG: AMIN domain-containing protein [Candidatus Eisenbacteria bacterium]|nr:AMIN domain-containing protein [Candidatus Eisenbacteria bacterium]